MSLLPLLAFCLLCWFSCAAKGAAAAESPSPPRTIWSGLILATNDSHPAQAPAPLRQLADKLKHIFGYNQFELVGEHSEKMDDPNERWLIPSKDFCLSVQSHSAPGEKYPLRVALFQNRRRLVEFEPHLNSESPLFIRGPLYAGGQLVIVLRFVDAPEPPRPAKLPPIVAVNPTPVLGSPAAKEKEHAALPPADHPPVDHPALLPADHFGPLPADRFGASPGPFRKEGMGDFDQKFSKP